MGDENDFREKQGDGSEQSRRESVTIDGEKLKSPKYLGSVISANELSDEDIEQRIGLQQGWLVQSETSDGVEGI